MPRPEHSRWRREPRHGLPLSRSTRPARDEPSRDSRHGRPTQVLGTARARSPGDPGGLYDPRRARNKGRQSVAGPVRGADEIRGRAGRSEGRTPTPNASQMMDGCNQPSGRPAVSTRAAASAPLGPGGALLRDIWETRPRQAAASNPWSPTAPAQSGRPLPAQDQEGRDITAVASANATASSIPRSTTVPTPTARGRLLTANHSTLRGSSEGPPAPE